MQYRDGIHATGFFRGYRLLLRPLRGAQLSNRNDVCPLVFCVEKRFPVFWYTLPMPYFRQMRVCHRVTVYALLLVPILLARVQTMSMCPNSYNTTGDAAARNNADVCVAFSGAVIDSF